MPARRANTGVPDSHAATGGDPPPADEADLADWFEEHYRSAAGEVVSFLAADGFTLEGRDVADIGSGDGLIDLGVFHLGHPRQLVGFDVEPTDAHRLDEWARRFGVANTLPEGLGFSGATPTGLPVADQSYDVVFSWSAFEHVEQPVHVALEMARILRPGGVLMLQLWPFYFSERGGHRWLWAREGFSHLAGDAASIESVAHSTPIADQPVTAERLLQGTLNRITLDELQRCLMVAGFVVTKLQILTETVHIPPKLARYPLSLLGISGVKLLAVRHPMF
jgi:SAM-dependent methyltransferase